MKASDVAAGQLDDLIREQLAAGYRERFPCPWCGVPLAEHDDDACAAKEPQMLGLTPLNEAAKVGNMERPGGA